MQSSLLQVSHTNAWIQRKNEGKKLAMRNTKISVVAKYFPSEFSSWFF